MGHGISIVYWAEGSAYIRPGGKHLTLQDLNINILWFRVKGMRWKDFGPLFDNKLKYNPPPDYPVVHLGLNDLGILC